MRLGSAVLIFVVAFGIGVGVARLHAPFVEWYLYAPEITRGEAAGMVGRRVRHVYLDGRFKLAKCPAGTDIDAPPEGVCRGVGRGERGSILRIEEWVPGQYFLVVRWEDSGRGEPMLSHVDSTLHRFSLEAE